MKPLFTILFLVVCYTSGAQNICRYNQIDSNDMRNGTWMIEKCRVAQPLTGVHRGNKICLTWGHYLYGKRQSQWYYWENGFLLAKENYDVHANTLESTIYHPNNQIKEYGWYSIQYGATDTVYEYVSDTSNKVMRILEYRETRTKTGKWKYYSKDGKLEKEETY